MGDDSEEHQQDGYAAALDELRFADISDIKVRLAQKE